MRALHPFPHFIGCLIVGLLLLTSPSAMGEVGHLCPGDAAGVICPDGDGTGVCDGAGTCVECVAEEACEDNNNGTKTEQTVVCAALPHPC